MLNKREGNVLLTPSALGPVVVASAALFTAGCGGGADTGSATSQTASVNCSDLSSVTVADTTFTLTKSMPAGDFAPPTGATIKDLPAFCRVAATVKPTSDSNIKVELWLPTAWNGKYLGTGNGGLGGTIDYEALANGLRRGFAVANTDLGTSAGVASMVGHVETIVDFGHRATHLMTTLSKTLVNRFYARAPSYSYWFGCSTGAVRACMRHNSIRRTTTASWLAHRVRLASLRIFLISGRGPRPSKTRRAISRSLSASSGPTMS